MAVMRWTIVVRWRVAELHSRAPLRDLIRLFPSQVHTAVRCAVQWATRQMMVESWRRWEKVRVGG